MYRPYARLFAVLALLHTSHASADEPYLVKDILDELGQDSTPQHITEFNGDIYFSADNGTAGRELWKSDGTAPGTEMVIDLLPGSGDGDPRGLTVYDGALFFVADDGLLGRELWRTDGTEAGTELVDDVGPGPASGVPQFDVTLVEAGGLLFFAADDGLHGQELWHTNGTAGGTRMIEDIHPGATGSDPRYLVELAGELLFVADEPVHGRELWKAGSSGLELVLDIHTTSGSGIGALHKADPTTVVMGATDGTHGGELWITDGTAAGTSMLADLCPGSCSSNPHSFISRNFVSGGVLQTQLYFSATVLGFGNEPWISDLTGLGTKMLADIDPGSAASDFSSAVFAGPILFFSARNGASGRELWRSDGTGTGTTQVADLNPGPASSITTIGDRAIAVLGGRIFFGGDDGGGAGNEPRSYDGSSISLLKDILRGPGASEPERFFPWNNHLIFTAEGPFGRELIRTNGSKTGTVLIKDIHEGTQSAYPGLLVALGDQVIFQATHNDWGTELWRSDGTLGGTALVSDIRPGPESSTPNRLTVVGGEVFFTADDGTHGRELWRSDGTEAGTALVADLTASGPSVISGLNALDDLLLFSFGDAAHGTELWGSDGTVAGTALVKDIHPGPASGLESSWLAARLDGDLYFKADDGLHGAELWKTNGTRIGTSMVADIHPTDSGIYTLPSRSLVTFDDQIVFPASDGVFGIEPWITDGTAGGTRRIADIHAGPADSSPTGFLQVGQSIFFAAYEAAFGLEFWKSDGTPGGTERVTDRVSAPAVDVAAPLALAGGQLFLQARTDAEGTELWSSDGSLQGSRLVRDIYRGPASSFPTDLGEINGRLLFSASGEEAGREIWASDGSEAGTVRYVDLQEGLASSDPTEGLQVGGTLFFVAEDAAYGRELWAIQPSCPSSLDLFERSLIGDADFEAVADVLFEQTSIGNGAEISATGGIAIRFGEGFSIEPESRLEVHLDPAVDCQ